MLGWALYLRRSLIDQVPAFRWRQALDLRGSLLHKPARCPVSLLDPNKKEFREDRGIDIDDDADSRPGGNPDCWDGQKYTYRQCR